MDKTFKLLLQIDHVSNQMSNCTWGIADEYDNAKYEYNRLSVEDDFLTGPEDDADYLAADVGEAIEMSSEYLEEVVNKLALFDKQLMKLIQLRGQLAEEIGIPLGGKEWVRLETYGM